MVVTIHIGVRRRGMTSDSGSGGGSHVGLIVGIIVGVLLVAAVVTIVVLVKTGKIGGAKGAA